jgi:hypothetical protein
MKKTLITLAISLGLMGAANLRAYVIVTEPTGGNDVSADKAVNSTNGTGYVSLGDIVLTEVAATDFAPGNDQTFILTAPMGWRLNPVAGASVSFLNSRDITAASVAVTASNLTVTFSVGGTSRLDKLTISGVHVQPLDGASDPNAGYLLNLSADSGTATIAGISRFNNLWFIEHHSRNAHEAGSLETALVGRYGRCCFRRPTRGHDFRPVWQSVLPGCYHSGKGQPGSGFRNASGYD